MNAPGVVPYATAIANAGRLKALGATRGTRAVAEAAWRPGGPSVEEIEGLYIRLRDRSRQERAA